jgi:hypothetical protein
MFFPGLVSGLGPKAVLRRDPAAVTRTFDGETVIVPVRRNVADLVSIYTLNETGTFLWNRCDGQTTIEQLVEALSDTFEVSRTKAWQDVKELLNDLCSEGLVHETPE